jgi:hypothetical protein
MGMQNMKRAMNIRSLLGQRAAALLGELDVAELLRVEPFAEVKQEGLLELVFNCQLALDVTLDENWEEVRSLDFAVLLADCHRVVDIVAFVR